MTRSIVLDLFLFFAPVAVGALACWLGGKLVRRSKGVQIAMVFFSLALLAIAALALREKLPLELAAIISGVGGGGFFASTVSLFLFGAARRAEKSSFSPQFLTLMCGFGLAMIVEESAGSLWWRFHEPYLWENKPDAMGRIRQTTGTTCAPTAAAMLLHKFGVESSEGEMAYWCGTSFFGTDTYSTTRALNHRLPEGKHAVVIETDYEGCLREGDPFLASIYLQQFGWHAVVVLGAKPEGVEIYDPMYEEGFRKIPRREFEEQCRGTFIVVRDER